MLMSEGWLLFIYARKYYSKFIWIFEVLLVESLWRKSIMKQIFNLVRNMSSFHLSLNNIIFTEVLGVCTKVAHKLLANCSTPIRIY